MKADVESMTREERRAWLAETKPRHDLTQILRAHQHLSSRNWPDGTPPSAPNWNPGCSCNEARDEVMYWFNWHGHVADALLAAGYAQVTPEDGEHPMNCYCDDCSRS